MSYYFHITRAPETWLSNEGHEITLDEWTRYLASDPEFVEAHANDPTTGERVPVTAAGVAEWTGHSEGEEIWFRWHRGNVSAKNPDDELKRKMQEVAASLGARVQGDEGEWYD